MCFPIGRSMRLTRPNVARLSLSAGKSEVIVFDDALPGFGVRLRGGGKRTWIAQYRLGSKQRRITLGNVATVDPDDARKLAKAVLGKVHLGGDPQADKGDARAKAAVTLGAVAQRYLTFAEGRLKPRSYDEVERHLKRHWSPLKELQLHKVKRAHVAARLNEIAKEHGPFAANRARASLSAMFTWALRQGVAEANPVIGTGKATEEISRDHVLKDAELAAIWKACREDDYDRIVRLLILTAQRREEVGALDEAELDEKAALWTMPRARTKNGMEHEVPLSDAALDILDAAPRREGRTLLFGEAEGGFGGWSKAKAALDGRIAKAAERGGVKVRPWRLHDIRRTVATRMADLGVLPHVVEAVLNHVSGTKAGVAGVYNRALYRAEKRHALADPWAEYVLALVSDRPPKVVGLPIRRETA
jgi:integrase